jgi:hypothetical protein
VQGQSIDEDMAPADKFWDKNGVPEIDILISGFPRGFGIAHGFRHQ